ncbi:hypothetical protein EBZ35_08035, partial [bacterium]|nr:hypothetical protein [bacterium]
WCAMKPGDLVRTTRHAYLKNHPVFDGSVGMIFIPEDELLLVLPGKKSWHTRVLTSDGVGWIFTDYLEKIE